MGSVEMNVMDSNKGVCVSAGNSASTEVSDEYDIFGESEILPRVGSEYQVELPSLITVSEYLRLSNSLAEAEITYRGPQNILTGMPIPVVWISEKTAENKDLEEQEAFEGVICVHISSEPKLEPLDVTSLNGTKLGESEDLLQNYAKAELQPEHGGQCQFLVPGGLGDIWSRIEEASFLLGLYIFGKNLVVVKRFIESKQMREMLSYYYGRFYGSKRYRRWSECRKAKSRRSIFGQRIFTGLRHQELLSRLLLHVSEECRFIVLQISKTYGEGKISLEQYVLTLKATFGLPALVEAVGVGKGKQDLTGIVMDTPKANQIAPLRPEVPMGKACSALTTTEIIKFLTGDFRLSKARSSDLFWEAVWPRLLERGWHSEEPYNHGFPAGSKHSLVFLIPGIKKFSRRKLVKGDHYFDCVSDVLSKVASNPELIEIECYRTKEENGWTDETKVDQEDVLNQRRHCYLKPRTSSHSTNVMKFTVVDTSLSNGKACTVREVRCLPGENMNSHTSLSDSEEDDGDILDELGDKYSSADTFGLNKDRTNDLRATMTNSCKTLPYGGNDFEYDVSKQSYLVHGACLNTLPAHNFEDKEAETLKGIQQDKATKSKFFQEMVSANIHPLVPVAKRRRRLPPSRKEVTCLSTTNSRVDFRFQQEAKSCINSSDFSESIPTHTKLPGTPITTTNGIANSNLSAAEHPLEKPPLRALFDLNIPLSHDAEIDNFMVDTTEAQDYKTNKELDKPQEVKSPECETNSEQEAKVSSRRHSTRNRPLTTKVLEAFACGYMDAKQKRKAKDAIPGENLRLRTPRRARASVTPPEGLNSFTLDFTVRQNGNAIRNSNAEVFNNPGNAIKNSNAEVFNYLGNDINFKTG
ncbi:uncharacterized protein LOC133819388 [Humulus lupulus]|uniref:uncharacterized protein LOC133819388 n=1 Tax=Humulus lupulus TaxID=3486 RepID=UPI002B40075C|nr:uncharacterized protein LOC133819388 [Humulus lupulus]XP_062108613.1 uncharacterized protein LOC133819388 [Humulus lupulus]XP_062108614.1 uncharacterized protein LOC133819388 [Humulus lupulus]XP_062108615.1 uncharacterized protein LOC133819388 [Humulus lupulus]